MSFLNFFKKLFGCPVEETRVVSQVIPVAEDTNLAFAGFLSNMISAGKIKNYKKLESFINKHYHGEDFQWSYNYAPTEEMKALAKQWVVLQYKCSDIQLHNYMASIY